jgi:hypothetical protein
MAVTSGDGWSIARLFFMLDLWIHEIDWTAQGFTSGSIGLTRAAASG